MPHRTCFHPINRWNKILPSYSSLKLGKHSSLLPTPPLSAITTVSLLLQITPFSCFWKGHIFLYSSLIACVVSKSHSPPQTKGHSLRACICAPSVSLRPRTTWVGYTTGTDYIFVEYFLVKTGNDTESPVDLHLILLPLPVIAVTSSFYTFNFYRNGITVHVVSSNFFSLVFEICDNTLGSTCFFLAAA